MKTKIYVPALALMLTLLLGGCGQLGKKADAPFLTIQYEEVAHLTDDSSSPYLDFAIDYNYLNENADSIAALINRCIQRELLGQRYASLMPEVAVDSFKNTYIRDYRAEVGELYQADLDLSSDRESIPAWYGQTYTLFTYVEEGHTGVLNVSASTFVESGGAHPNQWQRWMNFDTVTGKLLQKTDVFKAGAQSALEAMLLDKLIALQAEENPGQTIESLEDLQNIGILQLTDMFIPNNFLLAKDKVLFLFNRYDIAPYSVGEIVLEATYEELGEALNI